MLHIPVILPIKRQTYQDGESPMTIWQSTEGLRRTSNDVVRSQNVKQCEIFLVKGEGFTFAHIVQGTIDKISTKIHKISYCIKFSFKKTLELSLPLVKLLNHMKHSILI